MPTIQPPPTYVLPIILDERTKKSSFSPIWLKWFLDLMDALQEGLGVVSVSATAPVVSSGGSTPTISIGPYTSPINVPTINVDSVGGDAAAGNAVLVAGTVTVNTTLIAAGDLVILTRKTAGGTIGNLTYTVIAGTSFTINSDSATDTSTVSWFVVKVH